MSRQIDDIYDKLNDLLCVMKVTQQEIKALVMLMSREQQEQWLWHVERECRELEIHPITGKALY